MAIVQLDFFKNAEESEMEALRAEFNAVKKSTERVRKGVFVRHNELAKICTDLQSRLDILERNICKGVYDAK
jgi:hypothetical protein